MLRIYQGTVKLKQNLQPLFPSSFSTFLTNFPFVQGCRRRYQPRTKSVEQQGYETYIDYKTTKEIGESGTQKNNGNLEKKKKRNEK